MANNKTLTKVHKFHIVPIIGDERDTMASTIDSDHGSLVVRDADHQAVLIYAPGEWRYAEVNSKDE